MKLWYPTQLDQARGISKAALAAYVVERGLLIQAIEELLATLAQNSSAVAGAGPGSAKWEEILRVYESKRALLKELEDSTNGPTAAGGQNDG